MNQQCVQPSRDKLLEPLSDISQAFVDKGYLEDKGVADILLYPDPLFSFLKKHKLLKHFTAAENQKVAYFVDARKDHPESNSAIVEYKDARFVNNASVQVMMDTLLREEHLCPIRIMRSGNRYEMLLAPLSEDNLAVLNQFYAMFRVDIAHAYSVRKDILNKPFSSGELPTCLATLFIEQNALVEESGPEVEGIEVSDGSFNPDATIVAKSPEALVRLFKK